MKKFKFELPINMFVRKHYCPKCSNKLEIKKMKKVVNSKSEEAKNFDFSTDDGTLVGDVEFTWYVYYCSNCNIEITNKEMREIQHNRKGKKEALWDLYFS